MTLSHYEALRASFEALRANKFRAFLTGARPGDRQRQRDPGGHHFDSPAGTTSSIRSSASAPT